MFGSLMDIRLVSFLVQIMFTCTETEDYSTWEGNQPWTGGKV